MEQESLAYQMLNAISMDNKRKSITIWVLIIGMCISNLAWAYIYVNMEYEVITETTTVETTDDSNAIINEGGDVNVGENNKDKNSSQEE